MPTSWEKGAGRQRGAMGKKQDSRMPQRGGKQDMYLLWNVGVDEWDVGEQSRER